MSDGPNGVRGDGIGASRVAGVVMPVGIALAYGIARIPMTVLLGREDPDTGVRIRVAVPMAVLGVIILIRVLTLGTPNPDMPDAPYIGKATINMA